MDYLPTRLRSVLASLVANLTNVLYIIVATVAKSVNLFYRIQKMSNL